VQGPGVGRRQGGGQPARRGWPKPSITRQVLEGLALASHARSCPSVPSASRLIRNGNCAGCPSPPARVLSLSLSLSRSLCISQARELVRVAAQRDESPTFTGRTESRGTYSRALFIPGRLQPRNFSFSQRENNGRRQLDCRDPRSRPTLPRLTGAPAILIKEKKGLDLTARSRARPSTHRTHEQFVFFSSSCPLYRPTSG
jgi:hypothetical protein